MAQTFRPQNVLSLLNSDGKPHPRENSFALATAVLGVVAAISAIFPQLHLLSSWTGLAGIFTGGYGQFISATTGERFVLIIGLGAAAVGFFLGVAHGGLWGGL
jgi:ABC-type dipeptide/oligopeptide/nickel transport system permease subunit